MRSCSAAWVVFFFFSSRRRHTRFDCDWSSDVCSSDLFVGRQVLVRVTTDEGLVGWGECFAYGVPLAVCAVVEEALAPLVVGQDPTRIEHLVDTMQRALMIWGRRGLAMMAVSGVELALWDLTGKARGVPVYQLLGGLCTSRARVYASLLRYETPTKVRPAGPAAP